MKSKKLHLGFFYGGSDHTGKQDLTKAFNKITDGDLVRYVITTEMLICRFNSNQKINEITKTLKEYCPGIPFFVFPIPNNKWGYNLPLDVENNLLTDNPIIQTPVNQIINQVFAKVIDVLKKQGFEPEIIDEQNPNFTNLTIDHLNIRLQQAIKEDNYELAAQIRDKIKELNNFKNDTNNESTTTID